MFKKIVVGFIVVLVIAAGALFMINGKDNYDATKYSATVTDGMRVGSNLNFSLPDQFDKKYTLSDKTETIIFSFAKTTGHTVKDFLSKESKDYLPSRNAMFIADISPMPTVIRNTFALPDLKKSSFSVLLIYDKSIASQIKDDTKADKIAVVRLKNRTIVDVQYIETQEELQKALN